LDSRKGRRIVSLLPSATEIVCALGLEDRLVGISQSCDYPGSIVDRPRLSRPRAQLDGLSSREIDEAIRAALRDYGSVYEIDVERLAALEPDLVLTQGICDVCAVPERQLVAAIDPTLKSGTETLTLDAHDLQGVFTSIELVGRATGTEETAEQLITAMRRRIDAVHARVAGRPRPRVLAVEWLDPPYVPGHWVPELIAAAGGELLAGTARQPSYRMDWAALRELRPDVLLIMPCGFALDEARREAERYAPELRRVGGRLHALDASSYFSRSGPRVVDGLELLESAIFSM